MFCLVDLLNIFSSLWWTKGLERAPWKFKPLSDLSFIRRTRVDSWIPIRFRVLSVYTFSGTERFWSINMRNHFDFDSQQSLTDMYFVTPVFCEERNVKRQTITICTRYHKRSLVWWHWISSLSTLLSYDALVKTLFCTYQSVSLEIVMFVESSSSKFCILPKLWIGMHLMHRLADHYQIPILLSNSSGWKSIRMIMGKGHLCWNRTEAQLDFCTLNFSTKKPLFLGQDICLNRPYIGFVWLKGNPQYKRKMEASQNNGIKGAKTAN